MVQILIRKLLVTGAATYGVLGLALWGPAAVAPALAYDNRQGCDTENVEDGHDHVGRAPFRVTAHFHKNHRQHDCPDTDRDHHHPDGDDHARFSQESGPQALGYHGAPLAVIGLGSVAPSGCQASFSPASAAMNADGDASTSVTLPPNCPGLYVLSATTPSGLKVTTTVRETGGFPITSALDSAPGGGVPAGPALAMLLAGGLLVIGGGLIIYRRGSSNP